MHHNSILCDYVKGEFIIHTGESADCSLSSHQIEEVSIDIWKCTEATCAITSKTDDTYIVDFADKDVLETCASIVDTAPEARWTTLPRDLTTIHSHTDKVIRIIRICQFVK
ncbi:unnamed protein product [Nezara viridula]|uniref:Uncharacterized protein n=1 Tax=Nezara viridula TaxID=85310 RepID=A0A9P0HUM1_NEZVI|nr:unnamed protein product [Nezara viridula]